MRLHGHGLAVIAAACFSMGALAAEPANVAAGASPPREATLTEEVAASMRELLRAVTPEIVLPKIEVRLPALPF